MHYGYGYGGFWILAGLIALGLFLALVAVLVVIGVSGGGRQDRTHRSQPRQETRREPEDALEILRRRYAKGEITREEYMEMRDDLGH